MGAVSLALLFAAHRPGTSLVAVLARHLDSRRAARLPCHVLLLPQGLLSRLLSGSARVRRRRAGRAPLSGRDGLSAHFAKPAPVFSLSRARLPHHSMVR